MVVNTSAPGLLCYSDGYSSQPIQGMLASLFACILALPQSLNLGGQGEEKCGQRQGYCTHCIEITFGQLIFVE